MMKPKQFWNRRLLWLLLMAVAIPSISMLVTLTRLQWVRNLELTAYDVHINHLPQHKQDPRIVVIGMYDDTPEHLGVNSFPLPRAMHGRLIDVLHSAGAKVIAFDMWFTASSDPQDDHLFANAMRRSGGVLAALKTDFRPEGEEEKIGFTEPEQALKGPPDHPYITPGSIAVQRSYGSEVRWFLPYPADSDTGKRYPALSVSIVTHFSGQSAESPHIRDRFQDGPIDAPIGARDEILIRYAGPPETFKPIRYEDVLSGAWKHSHPFNFFKNKIVLIGQISSQSDNQTTPYGVMHGTEILANETQMLLQGDYLHHASEAANFLCKLVLCLLLAVCFWRNGIVGACLCLGTEAVVWSLITDRLFAVGGIWLDTVEPITILLLSFIPMSLSENRRLLRTFNRLMPEQDAGMILRSDGNARGATQEREVAIVFCDIRNFTRMSETLPATTVEEILHKFYTAGEQAADAPECDGDLDKFVGDEMMLRFEVKRRAEPHALRAVRWAFAMQNFAQALDATRVTGEIGFHIGIGISAGLVRVGTVSARNRIQATAIGDAVNVASRLQNATKELGRPILMGPDAYACIADRVDVEPLGEIIVKGKQEPVTVYYPIRLRE